jgi:hypothetical protein
MTEHHEKPAAAQPEVAPAIERKPPRAHFDAGDIDTQGNVVVWDHGPSRPDAPPDSDEFKAAAADAKAWHARHGEGPAPLTMHIHDAAHAIAVEPERYAIEPREVDDAEVDAEVAAIQEQRESAKKAAEEYVAAVQLQADRRAAIATVMARRAADRAADDEG